MTAVWAPATATSPDMLQRIDGIIHVDRRITSRQLAVQLSVSNGSAMVIIDAWDIRRYAQDGFLEVSQLITDIKGKPSVLNWWSILMLRVRPFCPGSSQVTNPGLTIMNQRRKGSQWSGIIHNHQEKISSRQLLPPERS